MPLAAGATFAGYTIVRLLGAGGMGEVYLAQHPRLPRQDALKVLSASISADRSYRERFNREADIAAGLWHPHIVEIHDRGEHDGQLWISMDYVDGTDAEQLLLRDHQRGLPIHQVCDIVSAVAEALDHAHQRHLLHRDIKPANILLTESDTEGQRILLADFGIARRTDEASGLTGTNMTVGTIAYAAPEQLLGQELDGRADQYALAATAFHLLTGQPPFPDPNPAVVISQHLSAAPPTLGAARPDLVPLDPVLAKAMAKDPKDRFARGVDFARALRHHLDGDADPGATRAWPVAASPTEARSWWRAGILVPAVLAVLLIVAIVVAATEFRRADDEQPTAGAHSTTTRTTAPATTAAAPAPSPSPATVTDTSTEIETVTETTQTTPAAPARVAIGANCSPVGATSTTADGSTAYCSTLQSDGTSIWSLTQGEIPSPTITATTDPTETPIPGVEEPPVRVCMQQTRLSRWECRESIRRANGLP